MEEHLEGNHHGDPGYEVQESGYEVQESSVCTKRSSRVTSKQAEQKAKLGIKKAKEKAAFKCPECSRVFGLKPNLKKHIEAIHEGKKPFICQRKSSRFARKQDLNRHVKAVHEGKEVHESTIFSHCTLLVLIDFCPV